jgi:hypothetical protein
MKRKRTWKIVSWPLLGDKKPDGEIELACNKCGHEAYLPTFGQSGDLVIAAVGMSLIFDRAGHIPPSVFMPAEVQCRNCRTVWARDKEIEHAE